MGFQSEVPSQSDLFEGEGLQNTVDAVGNVIESQADVSIIGVRGGLGTSKSVVLKLLEKLDAQNVILSTSVWIGSITLLLGCAYKIIF